MYDAGNFTLDDTLFLGMPGNSFVYGGDVLEQKGYNILTYVDSGLHVTSGTVPTPHSTMALLHLLEPSLHQLQN